MAYCKCKFEQYLTQIVSPILEDQTVVAGLDVESSPCDRLQPTVYQNIKYNMVDFIPFNNPE